MGEDDEDRLRFWLNTNVSGVIRIADSDWESLLAMFGIARADERERCAMIAESVPVADRNPALVRNEIVDKIRKRTGDTSSDKQGGHDG